MAPTQVGVNKENNMTKAKGGSGGGFKKVINQSNGKGTSIGRGMLSLSTMNKSKKRNFKKYRGQGK